MENVKLIRYVTLIVATFLAAGMALAGDHSTPTVPQSASSSKSSADEQPQPPPPSASITGLAPESPFLFFRKLMKMPAEKAELEIQKAPERFQDIIRAKVESYKKMPAQESERLLQVLDLRWYLFCGVDIQKEKLDGYIGSVPEEYQEIIRQRLERWFTIPEQQRTNILANLKMFSTEKKGGKPGRGWSEKHQDDRGWESPDGPKEPGQFGRKNGPEGPGNPWGGKEFDSNPTNRPPEFPPREMQGPKTPGKWGANQGPFTNKETFPFPKMKGPGAPPGDEDKGGFRFRGPRTNREQRAWMELNNFFSMSQEERAKVLRCLPREDREKTCKVMEMLDDLPPVERQNSLKILVEISAMSETERATYIQNAERWKSLSTEEKRFFRIFLIPTSTALPPTPPGFPTPKAD